MGADSEAGDVEPSQVHSVQRKLTAALLFSRWLECVRRQREALNCALTAVLVIGCLVDAFFPLVLTSQEGVLPYLRRMVQLWSVWRIAQLCHKTLPSAMFNAVTYCARKLPPPNQVRMAKLTRSGQGSWFSYVSCEMQGWRPAMEDAVVCAVDESGLRERGSSGNGSLALFAVFDGHGGREVSSIAAAQIVDRVSERLAQQSSPEESLKLALLDIEATLRKDNTLRKFDFVGCTATTALLSRTTLAVANVGDSRVFKCRAGQCVPLTRDHKPESPRERRRIEAANGKVTKMGPCYRIDGNLNLSRALGDLWYKDSRLDPADQKISPVGDVMFVDIDDEDEFVVLACDGVFELMTWDSTCEYIHQRIKHMPLAEIAEGLLDTCCAPTVWAALGKGTDNESVIIVDLKAT